jgi:ABC-type uncharacterized transport system permease subunit
MTDEPQRSAPAAGRPAAPIGPLFAALTGLTSLAILLQAVFAGEVIDPGRSGGWLSAHNVNADVVVGLAVVTAVYAFVVLRDSARPLVIGAVVLAVIAIAQTAIGHAITHSHDNGLLVIHVPLALLAFGLTIWLSVSAAALRRGAHG